MNRDELLAKAKPIIFSTEEVRAILDGHKTAAHQLPSKRIRDKWLEYEEEAGLVASSDVMVLRENDFLEQYMPYKVGDILYVRETWRQWVGGYSYKADAPEWACMWRPSIHMPKDAARIFLRVKSVEVKRLQDIVKGIDVSGIRKEGIIRPCCVCGTLSGHFNGDCREIMAKGECGMINTYAERWNKKIPKEYRAFYGWNANPWIYKTEFERIEWR